MIAHLKDRELGYLYEEKHWLGKCAQGKCLLHTILLSIIWYVSVDFHECKL